MTPFLQLGVVALVAIAGAIVGLYVDRKEHEAEKAKAKQDERQALLDFQQGQNDKIHDNRVAMSRTQL